MATQDEMERETGYAIARASIAISGPIIGICQVLIDKKIVTIDELKAAMDNVNKAGWDSPTMGYYNILHRAIFGA